MNMEFKKSLRFDACFLALALLFLCLQLFLPSSAIFYEGDHFVHLHNAWRMFNGEVVYKDFFHFTFPGTELWYLTLFRLFGADFWILNATIIFLGFGLTWVGLELSKQFLGGWFKYLPPALFLVFGFRWMGIDGSHRLFSVLLVLLALLAWLRLRRVYGLIAAGVLCGLSTFFTQTRGVAAVGGFTLFLLWETYQKRERWQHCLYSLVILLGSFSATVLLSISYFVATAGAEVFFKSTVGFFNRYYSAGNNYQLYFESLRTGYDNPYREGVRLFYLILVPLAYPFFLVERWLKRKDETAKADGGIVLVALVGFSLTLTIIAPNAPRLYQVSIPALILLCYLIPRARPRREVAAKIILVGLAVMACVLSFRVQTDSRAVQVNMPSGRAAFVPAFIAERYEWLSKNTKPGDYIFEAYHPSVYFPLHLRNATRMPFLQATVYTSPEQISWVIEDLEKKRPRFILWNGSWSKPQSMREANDNVGPLFDYLQGNYRLRESFTPYHGTLIEVWERTQ